MSSFATSLESAPHSARQDIRTIGLIGLGHCTSHFHHMLLPPLFPVFIREFGFSYAELGLLLTVWLVCLALRDATIVDAFWAFGQIAVAIASAGMRCPPVPPGAASRPVCRPADSRRAAARA